MTRKKKAKKGDDTPKIEVDCKYEIVYEDEAPKMIFNCKECEGPHNLGMKVCMQNVLQSYSKELIVENVGLSYYIDQEYFGSSMQILKLTREILNDLESFSSRNPYNDYFHSKSKNVCDGCELQPQTIYKRYSETILKGISIFYNDYSNYVKTLSTKSYRTKECQKCRDRTIDEFYVILNRFTELSKEILQAAYSIKLDLN